MPTSYEWQYMGDRVVVSLTVPKECEKQAIKIINKQEGKPECIQDLNNGLVALEYSEVNYGELANLDLLVQQGIPFESEWQAGCEFGVGTNYGRFTPKGEYVGLILYVGDQNPSMDELQNRLNNYDDLRDYIQAYKETHTPLPWDNQVNFGKRYLLNKLVLGN